MNRILSQTSHLLLLTGLACFTAHAGTFTVNPVRIELSPARPHVVVQISNRSDEVTTIQTQIMAWRTANNEDVYEASDDVLVNPPIFTLGPHEKQFMRLGLRRPNQTAAEIAYRLILDEVPRPQRPGFVGLQTVLRISIPIFAKPNGPAAAQLLWNLKHEATGLRVSVSNHGNAHIQIRRLQVRGADKQDPHLDKALSDYVLPSQAKSWVFETVRFTPSERISLHALTDAGQVHEILDPVAQ